MKIIYSDGELIEMLKSHAPDQKDRALRYIYKEYYFMAQTITSKSKTDEDLVADVFQDAVIGLYESIRHGRFRGDSAIKTYLYATIRNLWYGRARKLSRETDIEPEMENNIPERPAGLFEDEETVKLIGDLLEEVGEKCARLLKYFYYENFSMKEITGLMDFSNEKSAKTQKYKCMQKLMRLIDNNPRLRKTLLDMMVEQ